MSGCATRIAWFVPQRSQVDAQLLGFLIEVAALEAESLRCIGDMVLVPLQFGQDDLALKTLRPFG
jgi:hypothetical protein